MSTHRRTWQRREQQAASLFGSRRQPGSGSEGVPGRSRSDSDHPRVYLETKLRARHAAVELYDLVRAQAKREGRLPVLALATKGRPGVVLVIDPADLPAVAAELARAAEARPEPGSALDTTPMGWPPTMGRSAEPEDLMGGG